MAKEVYIDFAVNGSDVLADGVCDEPYVEPGHPARDHPELSVF